MLPLEALDSLPSPANHPPDGRLCAGYLTHHALAVLVDQGICGCLPIGVDDLKDHVMRTLDGVVRTAELNLSRLALGEILIDLDGSTRSSL